MEISEAPAPQDREASWQPDPLGRAPYRYWNGERWTESTSASTKSIPSKAARSLSGGGLAPPPDPRAPAPPPATVTRPRVVYMEAPAARNGMALAALICAIAGVVLGLTVFLFPIAFILGVLAMVFGFVSRERAERDPGLGRRTMATWGVILGFVAILLGLGGAAVLTIVADDNGGDPPSREFDGPHHERGNDEDLPRA